MERKPITKTRSKWERRGHVLPITPLTEEYVRRVHDGTLTAIVSPDEPGGFHMSISHMPNGPRQAQRYPTWDELADARYALGPDDDELVMRLPPPTEYVAVHDTCFHLHEARPGEIR